MNDQWQVREINEVEQWDALFKCISWSYFMQSSAYGEAIKITRGRGIRYFAFEQSGKPIAACQVQTKRLARLPLAYRINHGPIFLDESPSYEVRKNVMRLVREHWRLFRKGLLKIEPGLHDTEENRRLLRDLGYREIKDAEIWWSSRIDLSLDEEELRRRLVPTWRRQLDAASRNGHLSLRFSNSVESARWLIEKHEENMRSKGFETPSLEFARALYQVDSHNFHVLQVLLGGEPIAGACWFKFGAVAQLFIAWIGEKGREAKAGNFLYWNSVLEMKKVGCKWLDLGGLDCARGFTRFKQGMAGTEYRLCGDWISY